MKVSIDRKLCIGCALCEELCPEVFEVRDDGYAYIVVDEAGEELYDGVRDAADSCPVEAISTHE